MMLLIDEHAKSGALIYAKWDGARRLIPVYWKDGDWELLIMNSHGKNIGLRVGLFFGCEPTHYLPASWVENAGKMREALETHAEWARREKAGPDYGGMTRDTHPDGERVSSEWFYGNVDLCAKADAQTTETLAATEWPKGGAA